MEEVARLFGEEDEVMVFSEDIVINHESHELTVRKHGGATGGEEMVLEGGKQSTVIIQDAFHIEKA